MKLEQPGEYDRERYPNEDAGGENRRFHRITGTA
jgi:hypothetical protein